MKKRPLRKLGDVAQLVGGSTPSRENSDFWEGSIPWLSPTELPMPGRGIVMVQETRERITERGMSSCSATLLPPGTVLFSSRATIGKLGIVCAPITTNQGFVNFIPGPDLNSRYLAYTLWFSTEAISHLAGSTTFKEVSRTSLREFEIPVPSLVEQERIVQILDEANELRWLRAEADGLTSNLIPALFLEMFGDPLENLHGWPLLPLRELSERFSDGPFGSNLKSSHYVENGVRVVRLQNIGVGTFVDEDKAYISEDHFRSLIKHQCLPGDVIVGTLGNPNLRACILPYSIPEALNKADCPQIRPNKALATSEYLCWLLNMPSTLQMAAGLVAGQTRSRISMGRLADLTVPAPPIEIQQTFVSSVAEVDRLESMQTHSHRRIDDLLQSLLHRAFQGGL